MEEIVRALDVGYGNVKFVVGHSDITRPVVCDLFPSRSPAANDTDLGAGVLSKRNTVVVSVNGSRYEVGHDVALAHGTNDQTAILDPQFVISDAYMARVLGALHYIRDSMPNDRDTIDMLVVGLPVSTYDQYREVLGAKMRGTHQLPNDRQIKILDVRVFAQPLGAFFNFMYSREDQSNLDPERLKNQMNLVIDPGFYTFDWLLAKGMKTIPARSGAVNRAMSDIISAIAKEVAKTEGTTPAVAFRVIDEAIRENQTPRLFGREIPLEEYKRAATSVINEAVSELSKSVGDGADIDNIMLVGGGTEFFYPAIAEKFPKHRIITTKQSVFANVTGFQLAGERHMLQMHVRNRREVLNPV